MWNFFELFIGLSSQEMPSYFSIAFQLLSLSADPSIVRLLECDFRYVGILGLSRRDHIVERKADGMYAPLLTRYGDDTIRSLCRIDSGPELSQVSESTAILPPRYIANEPDLTSESRHAFI